MAHALPPTRLRSLLAFSVADFLAFFEQQNTTEITLSPFWAWALIETWQLLLLSFQDLAAMDLKLNFSVKRGHMGSERPSQKPAVPAPLVKPETRG